MRKKDYYEAYLDDFNKIIVYISKDSYGGQSNEFHLVDNNDQFIHLKIHTIETSGNYIKYTLGLDEDIVIGNEYYVMHQHARKAILNYSYITKTNKFDELFYYDKNDLGCSYRKNRSDFALWAPTASRVKLEIKKNDKISTFEMKRGDKGVYRISLVGDWEKATYVYLVRVHGVWQESIDPYGNSSIENSRRSAVVDMKRINVKKYSLPKMNSACDAIIYEASVRDFTSQEGIGVVNASKFRGFVEENETTIEKQVGFSYLKSLGVTHVQLMPVFDFGSVEEMNPKLKYNWGYDPMHYRTLEGSYSIDPRNPYGRMHGFANLVEECHKAGLRVNLDVVFNHVYDMEQSCFNKIVPNYFFQMNPEGDFSNGTFCGNDVDSTRKMCSKYIVDACEFIVRTYHIDGFRFDLMGILDIETINKVVKVCKEINPDFMVYGEGWDMPSFLNYTKRASMYNNTHMSQVAHFSDRFRDIVKGNTNDSGNKGYLSGGFHLREKMKNCLAGACVNVGLDKLFAHPSNSVNYVECHDNMTCWDKIKDCCREDSQEIKQAKHTMMIGAILLAQGIPFIHCGQEFARTKLGRHNTYEDNDDINHVDYTRKVRYQTIVEETKKLIQIRKEYACLRYSKASDVEKNVSFENIGDFALAYKSEDEHTKLTMIFNPSYQSYEYDLKQDYEMVYDMNQTIKTDKMSKVNVKPYSMMILKSDKEVATKES